jgi:endonuclease/exonuclease/phosphatase family metal-dependent hydrolase
MTDRGTELRIVSWNIHGAVRPDLDDLSTTLASFDADAIGLQEVRRHQARRLSINLGYHCVWVFKHNGYSRFLPRFAEGLAILSRWPMTHDGDTELGGPRSRSDFRRRVAAWATIEHPDGDFCFVDTHLASGNDAEERVRQASDVHRLLRDGLIQDCHHDDHEHDDRREPPTLVVGDLNDHREPDVVNALAGDLLRDAWVIAPGRSRSGLTNPASAPHQRLDHVLIPREWSVSRVEVPDPDDAWSRRSDHLPVIVTVQMRSK